MSRSPSPLRLWCPGLLALVACGGPPAAVGAAEEVVEAAGAGLEVRYADGARLLSGQAPGGARPGATITAEVVFVPGERPVTGELQLIGAGASEPTLTVPHAPAVWPAPGWTAGQAVRWTTTLALPADLSPGSYWLLWSLRDAATGEAVAAEPLPGGRVSLGVLRVSPDAPATPAAWSVPSAGLGGVATLAVGGDTNLGRRMNFLAARRGPQDAFAALSALRDADLSFLNLECVVATGGQAGALDKGEEAPFAYRGRPEQLAILQAAGIDVVGTANNHVGDYGMDALLEQQGLLAGAGLLGPGSGPNRAAACAPVYTRAGDLSAAFFSLDATEDAFAASATGPGTCHLSLDDTAAWSAELGPRIALARAHADLVFVAVHWGPNNKSRPQASTRAAARALVAAGADAVLGSSAHMVQGMEVIDGVPVLYDTGNLLFDSHLDGEMARSGLFLLELGAEGVRRVRVQPVVVGYGATTPDSGNGAVRTLTRLRDLSRELGTALRLDGVEAVLDLPQRPARPRPSDPRGAAPVARPAPPPRATPPEGCLVDAVPADAKVAPQTQGSLTLVGVKLSPPEISRRQLVIADLYWQVDAPLPEDLWFLQRLRHEGGDPDKQWWADHEACDFAWPTSRWAPHTIVHDRYAMRPPTDLARGTYTLTVALGDEDGPLGAPLELPGLVVR